MVLVYVQECAESKRGANEREYYKLTASRKRAMSFSRQFTKEEHNLFYRQVFKI